MLRGLRKKAVHVIATRHVAGPEIEDALKICRWTKRNGYRVILSPWKAPGEKPGNMLEHYACSIKAIIDEKISGYVAVKLNAIDNDPGIFKELADIARSGNVRVHLDSLDPESAPLSFKLIEKVMQSYKNLGTTLPSRWKRSLDDAERVSELGISARIVKGQWQDQSAPGIDARSNYLEIARRFSGRQSHIGVATHDRTLAEMASAILTSSGTPFELEQFFSLPLNTLDLAQKLGCGYRIYVPFGYPEVPYNVRFGIARPGIIGWVIKDFAVRRKKPWDRENGQDTASRTYEYSQFFSHGDMKRPTNFATSRPTKGPRETIQKENGKLDHQ